MDNYQDAQSNKTMPKHRFDLYAVLDAIEKHPIATLAIGAGFIASLVFGHDVMSHNYAISISKQNGFNLTPSANRLLT